MKKFLAVYMGEPSAMGTWNALSESERKSRMSQGMVAWKAWTEKYQADILEIGGPLGKTLRVDSSGIASIRNSLTGFVLVQAASHEAAAAMFEGHAHFTFFPGESVEIVEWLNMPDMG